MADLSNPTRIVVGLMRHRAVGLLLDQLRVTPDLAQKYLDIQEHSTSEEEFRAGVSDLMTFVAYADPEVFAAPLSQPMLASFASIFWAEMTEQLVMNTTCKFENFGTFHRALNLGQWNVSFKPDPGLDDPFLPIQGFDPHDPSLQGIGTLEGAVGEFLEPAYSSTKEILRLIDDKCRTALGICLMQLRKNSPQVDPSPKIYPDLAPDFFATGLRNVFYGMIPPHGTSLGESINLDFVSTLALAATLFTYYWWSTAFGIELTLIPGIAVVGIGLFYREKRSIGVLGKRKMIDAVTFRANTEFRELLSVNVPPAPAVAA